MLLLLVAAHPKALAKSELIDRLWPGTYVQEANLSNAIGELRKTLDDRRSPFRFIRTVHSFGYAFVAVLEDEATHGPPTPPDQITTTARLVWGGLSSRSSPASGFVGRDDSADITLAERTVSRRHARLRVSYERAHRSVQCLGGYRVCRPGAEQAAQLPYPLR